MVGSLLNKMIPLIIAGLYFGGMRGYSHAKGIPINDEFIDLTTKYLPNIGYFAIGALIQYSFLEDPRPNHRTTFEESIERGRFSIINGAIWAGVGGLSQLIGYGTGTFIGKLT